MKKSIWDKRIPTLLGIFLITIGVGVTTLLVKQGTLFQSKASPSEQPQNVRITNVTENSFTVSYTTEDLVIGSINYGKTQSLGQSGLDDRDQESGSLTSFNIHNITVRNLSPSTNYLFTITSGKDTYMNNSNPFEVTTGNTISESPTSQEPISGKIILPDGSAPKESIIYVTADNSQVVSTLTKPDGTYILPLNAVRTADFSSYYDFSQNKSLKILAINNSLTSNAKLTIDQIHPVPTITLSSNYDFTLNQTPVASSSSSLLGFPSFGSNSSTNGSTNTPQILTPEKDQGFTDQQPLFKGKAIPNENVDVTIHSDQTKTTVITDKNGNWSYRPKTPLAPGNHTITITTKNADGILKTITQSFVVFAAGSQVSGSATPSATLTPTQTPTLTPRLSPTPTQAAPTLTPTPIVIAAVSDTPVPTFTPTPTEVLTSTTPTPTTKLLPATGNASIMTAGILGIVISIIGALLFLMTRGGISAL